MDHVFVKDRLRLMLDHFGVVGDPREGCKVKYPLPEVLFLVLDRLAIKGALVTIDAIATNPAMAKAITDKGGDYLLALKRNQPTLHEEVAAYFDPSWNPAARSRKR